MNAQKIDNRAKSIYKRLGDLLDSETNLMFGQQMEIQECMTMAREIEEQTQKEITSPVVKTGCA